MPKASKDYEWARIERDFNLWDADGGGSISVDELKEADRELVNAFARHHRNEEVLDQYRPLNGERSDEHRETYGTEAIVLEERHQVAEADEHHERDIQVEFVVPLLGHDATVGADVSHECRVPAFAADRGPLRLHREPIQQRHYTLQHEHQRAESLRAGANTRAQRESQAHAVQSRHKTPARIDGPG